MRCEGFFREAMIVRSGTRMCPASLQFFACKVRVPGAIAGPGLHEFKEVENAMNTLRKLACCLFLAAAVAPFATVVAQEVDGLTVSDSADPAVASPKPVDGAARPAFDWDRYGNCICAALSSGHDGLRQGALRMLIMYGDAIEVPRAAVLEVVRMYRDHRDEHVRRMAVVALGRIDDAWALDFLRRSLAYERCPEVLATMQAVIADHRTVPEGTVLVEAPVRSAR